MILTVTPGINLSTVSGPISKAQLNQLGQPTVGLVPGSVVASDTNFSFLRITDGVYASLQLTNNSAPTDKKRLRVFVEASGTVGLAGINDAENVGTPLIGWTADNKCTVGPNSAANAAVNFGAPALAGTAGSLVEMLRLDGSNGNAASLRVNHLRHSTAGDWTAATMRVQHYVDTTPQGFIDFNPSGLSHGLSLGTCTALQAPVNVLNITGQSMGNSVGIGTMTPLSKLTVAGDIRLANNTNAILFTDQSGTTPYLQAQADGQFWFYSTTAAGAARPVWNCAMRSDTSAFLVNVPLKIGASGVAFKSVLKATVTQTPNGGSPLNAGTLYNVSSTVTGALPGALIVVDFPAQAWPNIQVRAVCSTADSVIVYYLNAGSSSFTIGATPLALYVFNT